MARIHHLLISHFRGIRRFEQTFDGNFVCLIGRGDSGKSTILEAISYVLSPSWNVPFYDNDFYNCDTEKSIEIEVTLRDVPADLLAEEKFGPYLRTLRLGTNEISDEIEEGEEALMTIRLEVKKDLEPKWNVLTHREVGIKPIGAGDRSRLNAFLVSDYLDRHFSWNKGSPLHTLFLQYAKPDDDDSTMIDALRQAKKMIDGATFARFENIVSKIESNAKMFGATISKTENTIDFKDIVIKDGKLSMHDRTVPFRMKGKGSRRLISMAIQTAIADVGGIILIDEVEQGLEPDRVQNLVNTFKNQHKGQVFITTHSRDVLVELTAANLFLVRKGAQNLTRFETSMQGVLRANPEAFFAKKVLVVEGHTEIGICRALNIHRYRLGHQTAGALGVRIAEGRGTTAFNYSRGFLKAGFAVALFCDSDEENKEAEKENLRKMGAIVVDWQKGDCIELAATRYLPFPAVLALLELAANIKQQDDSSITIEEIKNQLWNAVKAKYGKECPEITNLSDSVEIRKAIGMAAKTGAWFKSQDKGQQLGKLIFDNFENMEETNLMKKQLTALSNWIGD